MAPETPYGYLLVHFVEDPIGHSEKIYLSLSIGDDPLKWRRLNNGEPILESVQGTTGVRDPHIIRGLDGTFHIVATDLRVWRPGGQDWELYRRHGSRDIIIWDSPDLVHWSEARYVTVAPPNAGMAWAPETIYDPVTGEMVVHFASATFEADDPDHLGPVLAKLWTTRTRDFHNFTPAEPYLELPGGVIDMTVANANGKVYRFAKQDDTEPNNPLLEAGLASPGVRSMKVFQQRGSHIFSDDFETLASELGQNFAKNVEGPLIFQTNDKSRWYLWVDQYSHMPMGYNALTTTDLDSGVWEPVPSEDFQLPDNTKHGAVLPLTWEEYQRLDSFDFSVEGNA